MQDLRQIPRQEETIDWHAKELKAFGLLTVI